MSLVFICFIGISISLWANDSWLSIVTGCLISQVEEIILDRLRGREQARRSCLLHVMQRVLFEGRTIAMVIDPLGLFDWELASFDCFYVSLVLLDLLSSGVLEHGTAIEISLVPSGLQTNGAWPIFWLINSFKSLDFVQIINKLLLHLACWQFLTELTEIAMKVQSALRKLALFKSKFGIFQKILLGCFWRARQYFIPGSYLTILNLGLFILHLYQSLLV